MKYWNCILFFLISFSLIACGTRSSGVVTPTPPRKKEARQKQKPILKWDKHTSQAPPTIEEEDQSHKQRVLRTEKLLRELKLRKKQRQELGSSPEQTQTSSLSPINTLPKKNRESSETQSQAETTSVSPEPDSKPQVLTQDRRKVLEQTLAILEHPNAEEGTLSEAQKIVIVNEIQKQLYQFKDVSALLERDRRMDQLMGQIYFKFDDSQIPSKDRKKLIQSASFLLKELEQRDDLILQIAGHADERGSEEYNLALGGRRAQSVYNFLRVYSSDPGLLLPISFGEEFPAIPNSNEQAWNLNRRVEFNLLPKE